MEARSIECVSFMWMQLKISSLEQKSSISLCVVFGTVGSHSKLSFNNSNNKKYVTTVEAMYCINDKRQWFSASLPSESNDLNIRVQDWSTTKLLSVLTQGRKNIILRNLKDNLGKTYMLDINKGAQHTVYIPGCYLVVASLNWKAVLLELLGMKVIVLAN